MVSIIVPIYNAESTLMRCLDSILRQTITDFEVLLINDGSTDGSENICLRYSSVDERFRFFSQKNSGVSKARNLGLFHSKGDWITFIDADDWIEPDMLEFLTTIREENVDVVMGGYVMNTQKKITYSVLTAERIYKNNFSSYALSTLIPEASSYYDGFKMSFGIMANVCGKFVRKELLIKNQIQFDEKLKLGEDGLFWLKCYIKAKNFIIVNKHIYHYEIMPTTANFKFRPNILKFNEHYITAYHSLVNNIDQRMRDEYSVLIYYRAYICLRNLYLFHTNNNLSFPQKIQKLKKFQKSIQIKKKKLAFLPLFKRIEVSLLLKKQVYLLYLYSLLLMNLKKYKK